MLRTQDRRTGALLITKTEAITPPAPYPTIWSYSTARPATVAGPPPIATIAVQDYHKKAVSHTHRIHARAADSAEPGTTSIVAGLTKGTMMAEYKITWLIEVDANSAEDAARQAWDLMRGANSTANVFDVEGPDGKTVRVDLQELRQ